MQLEIANGAQLFRAAFLQGLVPEPHLSVAEWAERYRILTSVTSAEPGPWRNARTPFVVEIMEALSPAHPCGRVVIQKGAQVAGTEAGLNWLGYLIDQHPGPILVVRPNLKPEAERFSKQRLASMLAAVPRLKAKVRDGRSREGSETTYVKLFPGGILVIAGANSPVGLRSIPARDLFLDEVDAYETDAGEEGDPVTLAERATRTFPSSKKLLVSTPSLEGRSRIAAEFEESDQSFYWVPCPLCGAFQRLQWGDGTNLGISWTEHEPASVVYRCVECQETFPEHHKTEMLAAGEWRPTYPERSNYARGFHLSALYSPLGWFSWEDAVRLWEKAQGRPTLLKVFVNTVLGETWKEKGERPEWEDVFRFREEYPRGIVPPGGLILTSGTDVQQDRLEIEVVAWGPNLESWSVEYVVLPGDPFQEAVWADHDRILNRAWPTAGGGPELRIMAAAIDSKYSTQQAYRYVRQHPGNRVLAVQGKDQFPTLIGMPRAAEVTIAGKKMRRGVKYWPVGVSIAKTELYGWLRLKPPLKRGDPFPAGYCHFPGYQEDFFRGLTAEQLVPRIVRGYRRYLWEKVWPRNEPLDCRIYARAAAAVLGLDRFTEEDWKRIELELAGGDQAATPAKPGKRGPPRGDSYLSRWRTR